MENGKDHGPLAGWIIALVGGKYLLGRPSAQQARSPATMVLQPVYEISLMTTLANTPQGPQPVQGRNFGYILNYPFIRRLDLPSPVPTIPLEDFPMNERQDIANLIENMEKQAAASRAGIVIAPAGALSK